MCAYKGMLHSYNVQEDMGMTQEEMVLWVLVLVIIIQGVWLAGLTYLMWRKALQKKRAEEEEATRST
ncbi:MAG: hypothetical protein ACE5QW_02830 [Thermoplasmata archaeon]